MVYVNECDFCKEGNADSSCTRCSTRFHVTCINKWFKTSGRRTCPGCRMVLPENLYQIEQIQVPVPEVLRRSYTYTHKEIQDNAERDTVLISLGAIVGVCFGFWVGFIAGSVSTPTRNN